MSNKILNSNFRDLLPEVYSWWDKVLIEQTSEPKPACLNIVPSQLKEGSLEIDAPSLNEKICSQLIAEAKSLGWQGKSGFQMITLDDKSYVLVASSSLNTSVAQKSRQIGLDIADYVYHREIKEMSFCAASGLSCLDMLEGLSEGLYKLNSFKQESKKDNSLKHFPMKVSFLGEQPKADEINAKKHLCQAVALTKMLQDAPSNWLTPVRFAQVGKDIAEEFGFKVQIGGKTVLEDLGMGSFLSVGNGSPYEPQLIVVEIEGENKNETVALVGKGLTFDAGGVSLKPSAGMHEMKYDMSGGASVLGAVRYFGGVKPKKNVVCIIGAVENVISGHATKPGDIFTTMSGKTVEVLNTDAEGRLVLADLLYYAVTKFNPSMVVNIATLTGAVLQALGTAGGGLISNNESLAQRVLKVSQMAGEPFWQLPLWPELESETKSEIADLKNIAGPSTKAGTIMGGWFLKQFVKDTPWAHLDVAGTSWTCTATGFSKKGGAAYGMRTLIALCQQQD